MRSIVSTLSAAIVVSAIVSATPGLTGAAPEPAPEAAQAGVQSIDLAQQLSLGKLRPVNRHVSALPGTPGAVTVAERADNGVIWVEGTDFAQGTIEVDVRGRDVMGRSFVGIAFHRKNDDSYEGVYLRPFNFRTTDPARHQHAVQYMALPEFDWPRLRQDFPEEFENPVDASVEPTGWVALRVVVNPKTVQIYVGKVGSAALEVRKLGTLERGQVGLWTGNGSDGAFANLRITPRN